LGYPKSDLGYYLVWDIDHPKSDISIWLLTFALTVFAGAVGVGIGFGMQNIVGNFISGLVILAERPITIGDRVEVAGLVGQVELIRARSTVIRTNDNIAMIVPNSKFIDSPVTNWTYGDPRVRFRIPVGVAYGSNIDKVRAALVAAGKENPHTLSDPEPSVFLEKFGESSIETVRGVGYRFRER
jgi:small-conductance mechanosensitive channel